MKTTVEKLSTSPRLPTPKKDCMPDPFGTDDPALTSAQRKLLGEIEGEFDGRGRFAVTSWPKPRSSNPNFLSDELANWRAQSPDPASRDADDPGPE